MTNREEIERRRTFAIISHPDAGKTTLTEKLLLYGGAINQAGSVKGKQSAKHAVSDWMDIEKQRGISVTSSVLQFNYAGKCVNILDTPGHQDFSEDTYRTLMAADSAVMVIDAAKGVEAQTIKLFKVCTLRHIPIFTFINKMDREARDPFELMENIEEILGIKTYPMNWPIGCGKEFKGVFDRNARKVLAFSSDGRANGVKKVSETEAELGDPALDELLTPYLHQQLVDEIELLDGAAEEFDLDCVAAVEAECFPAAEAASKEEFAERIAAYGNHFWLLFKNGKLVSFMDGMVTDTPDLADEMYENAALHDENGAWQMIFGVNTLPAYRQHGYAGESLQKAIADAKEQGRKGLVLTCKERLVPYYAKFGFVDEGMTDKSTHGNVAWHQMRLTF